MNREGQVVLKKWEEVRQSNISHRDAPIPSRLRFMLVIIVTGGWYIGFSLGQRQSEGLSECRPMADPDWLKSGAAKSAAEVSAKSDSCKRRTSRRLEKVSKVLS